MSIGPNGIDMRPGCRICGDHYVDAPHCYEPEPDNDDLWWDRIAYLFEELPFPIRHRWGGDVREFVEGLDIARERRRKKLGRA